MSTIEVTNVGPIQHLSIPIPEAGGVVELIGSNGCGKTTAIRAVDSLLKGDGALPLRDGTLEGSVAGLGVTITVKKSTRRKGELEVVSINSEFEIGGLIDPGIADPVAADAKRMRELVRITAGDADGSIFKSLLGATEFDQFVPAEALEGGDILDKAQRVKRFLEKASRDQESEADKAAGQARAFRQAAEGVDLDAETDSAVLQERLEESIRGQAQIRRQKTSAEAENERIDKAQAELEEIQKNVTGDSVPDLKQSYASEESARDFIDAEIRQLQQQIKDKEAARALVIQQMDTLRLRIQNAERLQDQLEVVKQRADGVRPEVPSDEQIAAADEAVQAARMAVERGAVARQARENLQRAEQHDKRTTLFSETSKRLRAAAAAVDAKLTEMLPAESPLRFKNGRFILDTDRGETYLADLSDGERAKIAIDLVIPFMPENSVLTIDQRIWQDLSPKRRIAVAKHCRTRKVRVLTARCTDDAQVSANVIGDE